MRSRSEIKQRARRASVVSLIALILVALASPLWSGPLARLLTKQIILYSHRFRVQQVIVRGLHAVPESEILKLADIKAGTALYSVSAVKSKKSVELHPWIRYAYVWRRMPDTVEIRVTEREPVAALRSKELLIITSDSMIVAPIASGWVWDLPLLTPPRILSLRAGTALKDSATLLLLNEILTLRSVSREAWQNLSEVFFENGEIHAAVANPPTSLILREQTGELAWLAALEIIHTKAMPIAPMTQTLDLRFPGRIVITEKTTPVEEPIHG